MFLPIIQFLSILTPVTAITCYQKTGITQNQKTLALQALEQKTNITCEAEKYCLITQIRDWNHDGPRGGTGWFIHFIYWLNYFTDFV
jgi:hypothetical protein